MKRFIYVLPSVLLLCLAAICGADEIHSKNRKANELYKQGRYDEALKLYEDALLLSPSDEKLKMNRGSAMYKLGEFEKAEESYSEALSIKDKKARSDAHFNMGNILFKKAEQTRHQDLQGAQEKYKSALQHYIESLDLSPDAVDAKWNLQLTHQKIKELEQQQQQQQNQQDKNDKNKQDDKNKQQNDDRNKEQKDEQQKQPEDKNEEQQKDQNQEQQQQQQQQQSEMKESEERKDMKKEDARRLIELYADDADSLNKPDKKKAKIKQPEQDW